MKCDRPVLPIGSTGRLASCRVASAPAARYWHDHQPSAVVGTRARAPMKHIRVVLSYLLALCCLAGWIGENGRCGSNGGSTGTFSLTVTEFANGPTSGAATFELERSDEGASFSLSFVDSLGFSALLSGPGTPIVGEDRAIGEEEGLIG